MSIQAAATNPPQLSYSPTQAFPIDVGARMLYLEDPERQMTIEQALGQSEDWKHISKASPNFGFTSSAYWFRFDLFNTDAESQRIYIELPIPFLDDVRMFRLNEASVNSDMSIAEQHLVGDKFPFAQRPVIHQNLVMPFELEPGNNPMLLRVAAAGTVEAPLFIWEPESFSVANGDDRLIQGIWFGLIIIMVIYNLFLYALLKDISYLYYVSFATSYLMFQVCLKGYGFAYLWPNMIEWNGYAISVFVSLCNFFAYMFVLSFLDLRQHSPVAYKLVVAMAAINGALFVLTFVLPYSDTIRINSSMVVLSCIFSLSIGYWSWYNENRYAKHFCLAWTSAFAGVGILATTKFGWFPANFWTENAGQIGVMMLVALLSFALANRFNREKELRILAQDSSLHNERLARKSQEELLRSRAEANKRLEQKVAERTENLERAMSELESVNERLEIMSTTDALTNLANRGHFERSLEKEFKRAVRHQRQLSIILCDVDHFKTINDTFGHKAGDECLRSLARLFKQRVSRPGDLAARYGGEEFIFLLVDTPLENAKRLAEDLCERVSAMNFHFNGKPIPVTASFGVSSLEMLGMISADQLVTQADLALYQAKNNGRDQVISWNPTQNAPDAV